MRLLTLVRHAKSSWDYAELTDFERPLNDRGRRDAPAMAQRLTKLPQRPDLLLSSPAVRALTTATLFAEALGIKFEAIAIDAKIYDASLAALLKIVKGLDDGNRHVVVFGHNPGMSELAHALAPCTFDELPTCAVARLELDVKAWRDVTEGRGKLIDYLYPKDGAS